MRVSCNGCRVLRKGCSDDCSLRPCLQWIKSPESQAHATVFLAKFYGRAGLMNLINSGPHHLRPAIFRSLLYEACGRIVNPIYGSVGLLWSGSWQLCQSAVESVLRGAPITPIPSETAAAAAAPVPPVKAYDIRHVSKGPGGSRPTSDLHKVSGTARSRFKRPGAGRAGPDPCRVPFERAASHEPSASHATETGESLHSAETAEASHVSQGGPAEESDVELELTLGFEPAGRTSRPARPAPVAGRCEVSSRGDDTCHDDLGLELHA